MHENKLIKNHGITNEYSEEKKIKCHTFRLSITEASIYLKQIPRTIKKQATAISLIEEKWQTYRFKRIDCEIVRVMFSVLPTTRSEIFNRNITIRLS